MLQLLPKAISPNNVLRKAIWGPPLFAAWRPCFTTLVRTGTGVLLEQMDDSALQVRQPIIPGPPKYTMENGVRQSNRYTMKWIVNNVVATFE